MSFGRVLKRTHKGGKSLIVERRKVKTTQEAYPRLNLMGPPKYPTKSEMLFQKIPPEKI
jgi:hypothetical protein